MVVSNSGGMRRLKEMIKTALREEYKFDEIDAKVISSRFTLDDLNKELESCSKDIQENIKVHVFNREKLFGSNPYLRDVSITKECNGNMVYSHERRIRSNILALYSESERDLNTYLLKKEYFVLDKVADFPILYEKGKTVAWMTVEPHEIITLKNFIEEASGNVLICGCGLGYTAYMVALKDNVDSITILEKNEDVISLFENQVYPNIPNNDRINIIKCDANEYLNNTDLSVYDHVNVDLWYDVFDMIYPYLKCLMLEEEFPNTSFTYWIEQSLFIEIQRELLSYVATGRFIGRMPQLYKVVEGITLNSHELINNKESLNKLLSFDNIRTKLLEWAKNNMDIVEELGARIETDEDYYTSAATEYLSKTQR